MPETRPLTIQLPVESMGRLDLLAKESAHSRADIAAKAIEHYLDLQEWQTQAIREALEEADSPNAKFLEHDEVVNRMKELTRQ
ncbi:MAG: ribbon-helix-helix protein, CopG family [bacterium]|nr:ribbon-helix-helix protein, CopG family [bacterium]